MKETLPFSNASLSGKVNFVRKMLFTLPVKVKTSTMSTYCLIVHSSFDMQILEICKIRF